MKTSERVIVFLTILTAFLAVPGPAVIAQDVFTQTHTGFSVDNDGYVSNQYGNWLCTKITEKSYAIAGIGGSRVIESSSSDYNVGGYYGRFLSPSFSMMAGLSANKDVDDNLTNVHISTGLSWFPWANLYVQEKTKIGASVAMEYVPGEKRIQGMLLFTTIIGL